MHEISKCSDIILPLESTGWLWQTPSILLATQMLWIYVKINHNSSRDVHRGTAANRAFPLHDPRTYRLPAIQPPRGLWAEMILKREVLTGLKMTLLSRWVIATTECWLLLKTEGECRKETAALRSRCVPGISPRCLKRVLPQSLSECSLVPVPCGQDWLCLRSWQGHNRAV